MVPTEDLILITTEDTLEDPVVTIQAGISLTGPDLMVAVGHIIHGSETTSQATLLPPSTESSWEHLLS